MSVLLFFQKPEPETQKAKTSPWNHLFHALYSKSSEAIYYYAIFFKLGKDQNVKW